jgi:cystathionine beta-lyase/cystathionine gamma-synthase
MTESLGCAESFIEHPVIITHVFVPLKISQQHGISGTLIQLSMGIEDINDQWLWINWLGFVALHNFCVSPPDQLKKC